MESRRFCPARPLDKDGTLRLWNVTSEDDPIVLPGVDQGAFRLTFSSDGRYLAATNGAITTVWRTHDPTTPIQLRSPNESFAWVVAFSPDSNRLATANDGGSVSIWQLPEDGDTVLPTVSHLSAAGHEGLSEVAWSPDSRHIAAAGHAEVLLWDLNASADPTVLPTTETTSRP